MGESDTAVAVGEEISRLEVKAAVALKELYAELTPWQKRTQVHDIPSDHIASTTSPVSSAISSRSPEIANLATMTPSSPAWPVSR